MSKTLQQLRDLGIEFGEVSEEFFHDVFSFSVQVLFSRGFFRGLIGIK